MAHHLYLSITVTKNEAIISLVFRKYINLTLVIFCWWKEMHFHFQAYYIRFRIKPYHVLTRPQFIHSCHPWLDLTLLHILSWLIRCIDVHIISTLWYDKNIILHNCVHSFHFSADKTLRKLNSVLGHWDTMVTRLITWRGWTSFSFFDALDEYQYPV